MSKPDPNDLKQRVLAIAKELGFASVGVAMPDAATKAAPFLAKFLDEGRHGDMDWMAMHADRRMSPLALMPHARSVIMFGLSYAPADDPLHALKEKVRGTISVYAKGKDYHDILKSKLKHVARMIQADTKEDVKVFVDTAPLMEKPLAAAAALGWQGKHTNLVSRAHGSWLFLGAILTSAEIPADAHEADHCGSCRTCLDICPTNAFPAPYQLDARRCIAYLTIEHKGHIDAQFRKAIGNRIFGCDDCLAVCPWNKFADMSHEMRFSARTETDNPPLQDLLKLDDDAFRQRFSGTPIKRTGRDRFVRNVLIAAGNSGEPGLIPFVRDLLTDTSALVRAMAVWALYQLAGNDVIAEERSRCFGGETDPDVRREWNRELAA